MASSDRITLHYTNRVCVFVALDNQHAMRMCRIILSPAARLALQYVSKLSYKRQDFRGNICWQQNITFLLLPTWYTNFLFIYTNYIKLNFSTCFEGNPLIFRKSTTQIVHMQPLVSSLSANDCLVQLLSGCTRQSLAKSDDTRGCICTICVVDFLMTSGLRSKYVEEFNFI